MSLLECFKGVVSNKGRREFDWNDTLGIFFIELMRMIKMLKWKKFTYNVNPNDILTTAIIHLMEKSNFLIFLMS